MTAGLFFAQLANIKKFALKIQLMPEQKQDILKEHLNQWMLRNAGIYHALEKVEKGEREVREDIEY